jgi:predicted ATPase
VLEHLPEAAPLVSDLLHAASALRVLTTRSAPLGLAGEHVWTLGLLPEAAAVALFGARQARADFALAPADDAVVAARPARSPCWR